MNKNKRAFVWNDKEAQNQEYAYQQINDIAEEYEIEPFLSGGEHFAERINNAGLKYSDFTVEDFTEWKQRVVQKVMDAMIEAERSAFNSICIKKKIDNTNK